MKGVPLKKELPGSCHQPKSSVASTLSQAQIQNMEHVRMRNRISFSSHTLLLKMMSFRVNQKDQKITSHTIIQHFLIVPVKGQSDLIWIKKATMSEMHHINPYHWSTILHTPLHHPRFVLSKWEQVPHFEIYLKKKVWNPLLCFFCFLKTHK